MATACLMIEALESFFQGLPTTKNISKDIFIAYFKREAKLFPGLSDVAIDFYYNIRCAILHQAETTGGWRISRNSKDMLWNASSRIINANLFLEAVSESISNYINSLKESNWNSILWGNAIIKLNKLCSNCEIE